MTDQSWDTFVNRNTTYTTNDNEPDVIPMEISDEDDDFTGIWSSTGQPKTFISFSNKN